MAKQSKVTKLDYDRIEEAALMLDIRLTDAGYYLRAGYARTRIAALTEAVRQMRRDIEELPGEGAVEGIPSQAQEARALNRLNEQRQRQQRRAQGV